MGVGGLLDRVEASLVRKHLRKKPKKPKCAGINRSKLTIACSFSLAFGFFPLYIWLYLDELHCIKYSYMLLACVCFAYPVESLIALYNCRTPIILERPTPLLPTFTIKWHVRIAKSLHQSVLWLRPIQA